MHPLGVVPVQELSNLLPGLAWPTLAYTFV